MNIEFNSLVPLGQAAIVGVMALIGIVITQSWTTRRDYAKRKIELAEEVLALFYEVGDAIREIRHPASQAGEGSTRPRAENEDESIAKILDQAYVAFERYTKQEALFSSLRSKKYRFRAVFRGQSQEPFDIIEKSLRQIFASTYMLGSHYWQRQGKVPMEGEEFQHHLQEMHAHVDNFWLIPGRDKISPMVDEAITDASAKQYVRIDIWKKSVLTGQTENGGDAV